MANELRIGLLDGDPSIKSGRRMVIDSQPDFRVVYEEENGLTALERIPDLLIDVLVIDHRLKGIDGIEFSTRLIENLTSAQQPVPKIIITGPYFSHELQLASIRSGATELVTMEQGPEALINAIRAASTGGGEPDFELLLQYLNDSDAIHLGSQVFLMRLGELSEKEQAVLDLFEAMTPFEQIAETLDLQRYRVRQIFEKVMRRCGFATRSQLYLALFEAGKGNG
ncbi:MAG: response regulator transcription factor [Actinomycetales bacterium]|nr:response regulator transcription factor [Actinomycetales bacterium]